MNAAALDDLLAFLVEPSRAILAELGKSQANPSRIPTELKKPFVSLVAAVSNLNKTVMNQSEHDAFIEFETSVRAVTNSIVKGTNTIPLRDTFKGHGIQFLTLLSMANKFVSSKPNFMELERMFS